MTDDAVLTVAEVAGILRCSPSTVRRAVAAGEIPSVRVLGTIRIPALFLQTALTVPHTTDSSLANASSPASLGNPPVGVEVAGARSGVDGSSRERSQSGKCGTAERHEQAARIAPASPASPTPTSNH